MVERQRQLDAALRSIEHSVDPQTDAATQLFTWASFGQLEPSRHDFNMLRLLLLALLPQIAGVLLIVSRSA